MSNILDKPLESVHYFGVVGFFDHVSPLAIQFRYLDTLLCFPEHSVRTGKYWIPSLRVF